MYCSQKVLMYGSDSVDNTNPIDGIIAFFHGSGFCILISVMPTTAYVSRAKDSFLVKLVSQALLVSTRLFRSLSFSIS